MSTGFRAGPGTHPGSFTRSWVRCYTRGLPEEVRESRRAEMASDVFEQLEEAMQRGTTSRAAGAALFGRTVRGMVDDVTWRIREEAIMKGHSRAQAGRPTGLRAAWSATTQAWFTPAAVLLGLFNILAAVRVATDTESTMPGRVIGPAIMLSLGVAMFTGLWLRWQSRYAEGGPSVGGGLPAHHIAALSALAGVGIVSAVFGVMGSAMLLLAGVAALFGVVVAATRFRSRAGAVPERGPRPGRFRSPSGLADLLIVAGVLPSLGLFWLVIPPILALVVVAGVISTGPRLRGRPSSA